MGDAEVAAFVVDLRRIWAGGLAEHEFRAKYMDARAPSFLADVWDGLQHLLADADIRAKDPAYRDMQRRELDTLIGLLEGGASREELRKITFLAQSKLSD